MRTYSKDIIRTIRSGFRRFLAIVVITILGVAMFSGLEAACEDLRRSGDRFFDEQKLFDLRVMSTLGLTEEDTEALASLDEIEEAEGVWLETADVRIGDSTVSVTLQGLSRSFNIPYLLEGRMPEKADEAVVTKKFLDENHGSVGDLFIVREKEEEADPGEDPEEGPEEGPGNDPEEDGEDDPAAELEDLDFGETGPALRYREFRIVGSVTDALEVNNAESGTVSFRNVSTNRDTVYVLPEAFDTELYAVIYLRAAGTEELYCYDEEYQTRVASVKDRIETEIMEAREKARYEEITEEAGEKIEEAEEDVLEELEEARKELEDGEKELEEELQKAEEEIKEGEEELEDGRQKLEEGEEELDKKSQEAEGQLAYAQQQLADKRIQLQNADSELKKKEEEAAPQIADAEGKIAAGREELDTQEKTAQEQISSGREQIAAAQEQITAGQEQVTAGQDQIAAARDQITAALEQVAAGQEQIAAAQGEVTAGQNQITASLEQVAAGLSEAQAGAAELAANRQAAEGELAQVEQALATAAEEEQPELLAKKEALTQQIAGIAGQEAGTQQKITELNAQQGELSAQLEGLNAQQADLAGQLEGLNAQQTDLEAKQAELDAQQAELDAKQAELTAGQAELDAQQAELDAQEQSAKEQIAAARAEIDEQEKTLNEQKEALRSARSQIDDGYAQLSQGEAAYAQQAASARQQIADARTELEENRKTLEEGEQELEEGKSDLKKGRKEGREELDEGWQEYHEGEAEAEEKIADAREKLSEIEMADWYVQDRTSLGGYSNIGSDADSIEAIATVFPIVFFIVAILISLTTIARMVDEDRVLIGTYKALGFRDREIRRKYLVYTGLAGGIGGAVGSLFAFLFLPWFIFTIFSTMYLLPEYRYSFLPGYGIAGIALFVGGVMISAWSACRNELRNTPAALMRPRAPKPGMRVFLERIPALWKKMSFLNKITARNLFRYKGRMLMTIAGTAGCTALMLFGLAIGDSVHDLMPRQYDQTMHYDLLAVTEPADHAVLEEALDTEEVSGHAEALITTVVLKNDADKELSAQLIVVPDGEDLTDYVTLETIRGEERTLQDGEVFVSRNAGIVLGLEAGDVFRAQLPDLDQAELTATAMVKNYLGNYLFMTADTYEEAYDVYEPNAALVKFSEDTDQKAFCSSLSEKEEILTSVGTLDLKENFDTSFKLMHMVVYVVIIMSAALAFVVLFTLATTNISERERELATIKVLGFFDPEVHQYINKETLILTGIGILLGIPLGYAFAQTMTSILNLPAIYLAVSLHPSSYLISAGLSVGFALTVNLITDRTLNRIDPVEALKSVE